MRVLKYTNKFILLSNSDVSISLQSEGFKINKLIVYSKNPKVSISLQSEGFKMDNENKRMLAVMFQSLYRVRVLKYNKEAA